MRDILIWSLLALPCFAVASQKPEQLQGCYVKETYTSDVTAEVEEKVTVHDTLKISKAANEKWEFSATFNGANFHQCSAWGTFKIRKAGGNTILIVTPAEDTELGDVYQCKLQILVTSSSFEFREFEGSQCEALFQCGARSHIGGQVFSRKHKVRPSDKRCNP